MAELLGRLRFVGGPVETLYLNQTRVRESFIGQLGAIETFTRTATKEGSIEVPVVKVGAGLASEAGVTWTLTDPAAQALVLRASLESQGALRGLDAAGPGRYISFAGAGSVSRPGMLDDRHRAELRERPGLYDAFEAERGTQESVLRMMEGDDGAGRIVSSRPSHARLDILICRQSRYRSTACAVCRVGGCLRPGAVSCYSWSARQSPGTMAVTMRISSQPEAADRRMPRRALEGPPGRRREHSAESSG